MLEDITLKAAQRMRYIAGVRWRLLTIRPRRIGDIVEIGGPQLVRASTSRRQGEWLAKLAVRAARSAGEPVRVLELGTCVGISGMYLLSGMAEERGGHLATFEGRPELAERAKRNMREFIERFALGNVGFEVVVGWFQDSYEPYVRSALGPFHLVFIDGHHQAEPTLRYHAIARAALAENGIIVHDDIAWSSGMAQAWRSIRETEKDHLIVELLQGNRPSRGIIFYGQSPAASTPRFHVDRLPERVLRRAVAVWTQRKQSAVS